MIYKDKFNNLTVLRFWTLMMNEKQTATRLKKVAKQNLDWRQKFWPEIKDEDLWLRKSKVGFITVPRGLPQIMAFIDALTKNTPASKAYFALWCMNRTGFVGDFLFKLGHLT